VFGPMWPEVAGGWRKLHAELLHCLCYSQSDGGCDGRKMWHARGEINTQSSGFGEGT
jgi:hypothetical protein